MFRSTAIKTELTNYHFLHGDAQRRLADFHRSSLVYVRI